MDRLQAAAIRRDLDKKMVLLAGPRQVGKSFLARSLLPGFPRPVYLNYDNVQDRAVILGQSWPGDTDLLVLDELHKLRKWKAFLKGIYDTRRPGMRMLVTGSARLETFRRSGDSLAGRYFLHRLLPLSPAEASAAGMPKGLDHFLGRGGFPEPFLADDERDVGRWRKQYLDGLIREDILSFENIHQVRAMSLLVELLRERVASPLSYQSLSEDLGVSPNTIKHYVEILEALYIVFRVQPYSGRVARSLQRQPKLYFHDVGLVNGDDGRRLENLVAVCLQKRLAFLEDSDGTTRTLQYLRTKDGREVDFVTVEAGKPVLMVEVKTSDGTLTSGLRYFNDRYGLSGVQLVGDLRLETDHGQLAVRKALPWLSALEI